MYRMTYIKMINEESKKEYAYAETKRKLIDTIDLLIHSGYIITNVCILTNHKRVNERGKEYFVVRRFKQVD